MNSHRLQKQKDYKRRILLTCFLLLLLIKLLKPELPLRINTIIHSKKTLTITGKKEKHFDRLWYVAAIYCHCKAWYSIVKVNNQSTKYCYNCCLLQCVQQWRLLSQFCQYMVVTCKCSLSCFRCNWQSAMSVLVNTEGSFSWPALNGYV